MASRGRGITKIPRLPYDSRGTTNIQSLILLGDSELPSAYTY